MSAASTRQRCFLFFYRMARQNMCCEQPDERIGLIWQQFMGWSKTWHDAFRMIRNDNTMQDWR
jgi:transposase-like protein